MLGLTRPPRLRNPDQHAWWGGTMLVFLSPFLFFAGGLLIFPYVHATTTPTPPSAAATLYASIGGLACLASFVLLATFPIWTYLDTRHLQTANLGWQPVPRNWLLITTGSLVLSPIALCCAAYYLWKRAQYTGAPSRQFWRV